MCWHYMSQDGMRCLPDSRSKGEKRKKRKEGIQQDTGTLAACKDANKECTQQGAHRQMRMGGMPCASSRLCRSEGAGAPRFFCREPFFSVTGIYRFRYFVRSVWIVGIKKGMSPPCGYASRRSLFAPVIVVSKRFQFAAAFFFK